MRRMKSTADLYGEAFARLDRMHRRIEAFQRQVDEASGRPLLACAAPAPWPEQCDDEPTRERVTPKPREQSALDEFRLALATLRTL